MPQMSPIYWGIFPVFMACLMMMWFSFIVDVGVLHGGNKGGVMSSVSSEW